VTDLDGISLVLAEVEGAQKVRRGRVGERDLDDVFTV
jgi:hypothetical protein